MIKKGKIIILAIILVLAVGLRLYHLGSNPPGLTWDEAALGYNAYSILHTGRDEYGKLLPLTLQSFGDYKAAMYAYYAIPSIAVFGLNEFAVRLPSALFGVAAVFFVYLLVKKLFNNETIGLIAAFVLAVSPWHLQYSRGAWEANASLTIILAAVYFFYRGLEKWRWFIGSVSLFALSLYTYQSSRLFVPLLVLGLLIIYRRQFWPLRFANLIPVAIGVVLSMPFLFIILNPAARSRLTVESMFSYYRPAAETIALAKDDNVSSQSAQFRLFHSQKELWIRAIIEREVNYITPSYLFVTGDTGERQHTPGVAVEYWIWLPFYVFGFYFLARRNWQHKAIILFWLLVSPLPAILSRDSTTSLRSLQEIFAIDVLIGLGIWGSWTAVKRTRFWLPLVAVTSLAFLFSSFFYLDSYYVHMPKRFSQYWLYGYKQVAQYIAPLYKNYDHIVMTTDKNEPYIYVLFYLQPDPRIVQQQIHLTATRGIDVGEVQKFDKFIFRHIYWPQDRGTPKTLYIGTEEELPKQDIDPKQADLLTTIPYLNGSTAFRIVETK